MFIFVGEKRSPRAKAMGVTWVDGRLSASTLHTALSACGVDPHQQRYLNLFDGRSKGLLVKTSALRSLRQVTSQAQPATIVALGQQVSARLTRYGIAHLAMVHPAARGCIRRKDRYQAHVAHVLGRECVGVL